MDIQKILALLHEERRRVNDVILSLERLQSSQGRKNEPTASSQQGSEGGKRTGTAGPVARAKTDKPEQKVKSKAAGN
jgi:hypothetical protein